MFLALKKDQILNLMAMGDISSTQETEYSVSCVERENPPILFIYSIWLMITFFKHSLEGFLCFGKSS